MIKVTLSPLLGWLFIDTERLIGEAAKNQASLNPDRTVFDVKRLISRKFDDPVVQNVALTYKVVNREGKPYIQVKLKDGVKVFSPEEIGAMILQKMKETAESYLGKTENLARKSALFQDEHEQAS